MVSPAVRGQGGADTDRPAASEPKPRRVRPGFDTGATTRGERTRRAPPLGRPSPDDLDADEYEDIEDSPRGYPRRDSGSSTAAAPAGQREARPAPAPASSPSSSSSPSAGSASRGRSSTSEAAPEPPSSSDSETSEASRWGGRDKLFGARSGTPLFSGGGVGYNDDPARRPMRAGKAKPVVKAGGDIPVVRERGAAGGDLRDFFSDRSWRALGATAEVATALATLGITRPSHVQAQAYDAFLRSDSVHLALADQAGSGKTLAYLLPLIQQLRKQEADAGGARLARPDSPRCIIMAPTVELVQQVHRVAKALSGAGVPFRCVIMTGGEGDETERNKSWRTQRETLAGGVDLLVATPGRLLEHLQRGNLNLNSCNALVMDEVDILLGSNSAFLEQVQPLQDAAPEAMRFVLVTATLPAHVYAALQEAFPDLATAFGPGLHKTSRGLTEELVDCSGGDVISLEAGTERKLEALRSALRKHSGRRVIVFCNKLEACRSVENYLRRQDRAEREYRVLAYHEAVAEKSRLLSLNAFLVPDAPLRAAAPGDGPAPSHVEPPYVLVCTDRTSRGIDSIYCDHVVLFDFPRDPSEYVRRVGRTARGAGGVGVVTALVMGRQVALAQGVMQRNEKGVPVHRLPDGVEGPRE